MPFFSLHILSFPVPAFPHRGIGRIDPLIAGTVLIVIVHDAAGLQVGIHRDAAHVLEAVFLQFLCDLIRQAVPCRNTLALMADIQDCLSIAVFPQPVAEASVLRPDFLKAPGVVLY